MTNRFTIRRPMSLDYAAMAELLNGLRSTIGPASPSPGVADVSAEQIAAMVAVHPGQSDWFVAERDGAVLGFQHIAPYPGLPDEACDIASFVAAGRQQLDIGTALFDATKQAARQLGYGWICACIRADNTGGLAYYQSRGFRVYDHIEAAGQPNGAQADQVLCRFDLD